MKRIFLHIFSNLVIFMYTCNSYSSIHTISRPNPLTQRSTRILTRITQALSDPGTLYSTLILSWDNEFRGSNLTSYFLGPRSHSGFKVSSKTITISKNKNDNKNLTLTCEFSTLGLLVKGWVTPLASKDIYVHWRNK